MDSHSHLQLFTNISLFSGNFSSVFGISFRCSLIIHVGFNYYNISGLYEKYHRGGQYKDYTPNRTKDCLQAVRHGMQHRLTAQV